MAWLKWSGISVAALLLTVAALAVYGRRRWSGLTAELLTRLESGRTKLQPNRYDTRELDGLPPVVQRHFRAALSDGMPLVAAVSIEQSGTFNMHESTEQWKPFTATQRVVTRRPGFVWDGRIVMLPGLSVAVHDAYILGEGFLHPAIAGLVTLADMHGAGEIAQGELTRFFAEASWYPTALLPSQGVRWEGVNERSARATLSDGSISSTLVFTFGADDLIESVVAEARGRAVAGKIIPTTWEGRCGNYQMRHGMRVPMTAEAAWLLPAGRKPYWRGTIRALRYEFASDHASARADAAAIDGMRMS
jgi:hypothetical protein